MKEEGKEEKKEGTTTKQGQKEGACVRVHVFVCVMCRLTFESTNKITLRIVRNLNRVWPTFRIWTVSRNTETNIMYQNIV